LDDAGELNVTGEKALKEITFTPVSNPIGSAGKLPLKILPRLETAR
jgi:hypothetical protein